MFGIPGYVISEELYNGSRAKVYQGYREIDSLNVVIKVLKNPYPSFSELLSFRNQYTITKNINSPLIIQTYSLEPYQNSYALVMEDGGISLKEWGIKGNLQSIQAFLEVAIALCDTLDLLYHEQIIHKDIKPSNILINPVTKQIKLIDFSIASLLPRETQILANSKALEGTLAYISPEQTGRMNRLIDYRTDFYSLGVTFYELLTGELPFSSNDPMELVHSHIAKQPPKIESRREEIPKVLGDIISKLMAKNPEDRYQSALGIKFDLENCLNQLVETGRIESFAIAQKDVCDRFIIPDKLYGRETEVESLLQAFERVSLGTTEMMLIAGFSGIGKTAVVNEVQKPIVRQRGYFIKGKYDQFNRNIPLSAFVQAFRDLIAQLLTQSDSQIQVFKHKILAAVAENGQVIIDVIPELEKIIGKQPPAIELSSTAAENRFNSLFQKFTQVFTKAEHPLVMFLDDLQWADAASLKLIQLLMADTSYLLLIGAYRNNEVTGGHPLILTINELQKKQATINTITLTPLNQIQVNELVADTLKCTENLALPLSKLVFQKTQGNPFFATQFLKALHQDGLIKFDLNLGGWQCDITQVTTQAVTDDVVAFMSLQLQKLPLLTQQALQLAACLGNSFDLDTLAIVSQQSQIETATALWKALQEGLILPINEVYKFYVGQEALADNLENRETVTYKFLHDRVQQAAYSLIAEERKQTTHLQIGQLLLRNSAVSELEERLFEIVNHLNVGISLIRQPQERENLAELNLAAGRKAKTATAHSAAIDYLATGIKLLPETLWTSHYALTLALHEEIAEASYLNTDFEQMERWANIVLQNTNILLDTIKVQQTRIMGAKAQGKFREAIAIGLQILSPLGIEFPAQPTQEDIKQAFGITRALWVDKHPLSLLDLPTMSDPQLLAAMEIMTVLVSAAYMSGSNLMSLLIFKQLELSIQSGNSPISVFAYGDYGVILCGVIGDIENGYKFGELALILRERLQLITSKPRNWYVVYAFIKHWKDPLSEIISGLQETYRSALETGDIEIASLSGVVACCYGFYMGQELSELTQTINAYYQTIHQYKHTTSRHEQEIYQQTVLNLLGQVEGLPYHLTGAVFNQEIDIPHLQATNQHTPLFMWCVNQCILYYLFGKYTEAAAISAQTPQYLDGAIATFLVPLYHFFDALIQLTQYPTAATPQEQQSILLKVQQHQTQLQHWGIFAPSNHQHRWQIVEAERCRVLGNKTDAIEAYDRAISLAKNHKLIQDEALANELAAKFYLDWGKEKVAASYMQEAYYCYARWGAKAKINDLKQRYPDLLQPVLSSTTQPLNLFESLAAIAPNQSISAFTESNHSNTGVNTSLDFVTILKASQSLSGTIQLDELLHQLSQIILQHSGGDRCAVFLPNRDNIWQLEALATFEATEIISVPLDSDISLPVKLIHYVKNTQEIVVIDRLETNLPIIDDYLRQQQPQSLLCLPLLNQGKAIAILYLENQLTSGVFSRDRLLILNFLCTQAAISLENARLFAQRLQAETTLAQSEARFRSLVEDGSDLIYALSLQGIFTYVSPQATEIIGGYQPADVIGKSYYDFTHPDDLPQLINNIKQLLETGKKQNSLEIRVPRKDGSWRWVVFNNSPIKDRSGQIIGIQGIGRDITVEKNIRQERQRQADALKAIVEGTAGKTGQDFYQACTQYLATIFDVKYALLTKLLDRSFTKTQILSFWTGEEFLEPFIVDLAGTPCLATYENSWSIFPHSVQTYFPNASTLCSLGAESYMSVVIRNFEGHILGNLAILDTKPLSADTSALKFILQIFANRVAAEMERQADEEELRQTNHRLEVTISELQRATRLKDEFLATMSHELRTPLNAILGMTEGLQDEVFGLVNEKQVKALSTIERSGTHLLELINDILDVSKIASGQIALDYANTAIIPLCQQSLEFIKPQAAKKSIHLESKLPIDLPNLTIDERRIRQVLINLLNNAVKFTPEGGCITLEVVCPVTIEQQNYLQVLVRDTGIGIALENLNKVFEPFIQIDSSLNRKYEGTGLGLALVKRIIELHGGDVSLTSELGVGSCFAIALPLSLQ